jgi:hypothetical protein
LCYNDIEQAKVYLRWLEQEAVYMPRIALTKDDKGHKHLAKNKKTRFSFPPFHSPTCFQFQVQGIICLNNRRYGAAVLASWLIVSRVSP